MRSSGGWVVTGSGDEKPAGREGGKVGEPSGKPVLFNPFVSNQRPCFATTTNLSQRLQTQPAAMTPRYIWKDELEYEKQRVGR
jgi:hypothetical protein